MKITAEVDLEFYCRECGDTLDVKAGDRNKHELYVVPCAVCLEREASGGYDAGRADGREEAEHDLEQKYSPTVRLVQKVMEGAGGGGS